MPARWRRRRPVGGDHNSSGSVARLPVRVRAGDRQPDRRHPRRRRPPLTAGALVQLLRPHAQATSTARPARGSPRSSATQSAAQVLRDPGLRPVVRRRAVRVEGRARRHQAGADMARGRSGVELVGTTPRSRSSRRSTPAKAVPFCLEFSSWNIVENAEARSRPRRLRRRHIEITQRLPTVEWQPSRTGSWSGNRSRASASSSRRRPLARPSSRTSARSSRDNCDGLR